MAPLLYPRRGPPINDGPMPWKSLSYPTRATQYHPPFPPSAGLRVGTLLGVSLRRKRDHVCVLRERFPGIDPLKRSPGTGSLPCYYVCRTWPAVAYAIFGAFRSLAWDQHQAWLRCLPSRFVIDRASLAPNPSTLALVRSSRVGRTQGMEGRTGHCRLEPPQIDVPLSWSRRFNLFGTSCDRLRERESVCVLPWTWRATL